MNAIIICGGLSTRLGDMTKDIPKVLLEIGPKTVLDWQINQLGKAGVTDVVLAAGHLAHVLRDAVGDTRQGLSIQYAIEDKKLGTGGAIKHAFRYLEHVDDPVFVLNGDVLSSCDFSQMIRSLRLNSQGIIMGARVDDASHYGTLDYDDERRLRAFQEKKGNATHGYVNGGVYLFTKQVQSFFPREEAFSVEYDVFPALTDLDVYPWDGIWIDVGVPDRLSWAREHWNLFV